MASQQQFKAKLTSRGPKGSWTYVVVPFSVEKAWGSKARVPVLGCINGFAIQSSLMPQGDGTHYLVVNKAMQTGAKAQPGDEVEVSLELDMAQRMLALPVELEDVLAEHPEVAKLFQQFSYSHRKEYADWIATAKQAETRQRRAAKAVEMILEKTRLK